MPKSKTKKKSSRASKRRKSPRGMRPFWSGTISFGLVSVPVHLFPATRGTRVSLRLLDSDGTPLKRRYYCPAEDRDVHPEHILRGYDIEDGEYVIVRDDELESLEPEKSRDIDLRRFVDLDEISPAYFDRPYFLTPAGDSTKAYRLLADVMEKTGRGGIATFVMRGKEYLVAILAERGLLRAQTLRFSEELRTPEDIPLPEPIKTEKTMVSRMRKAIQSLHAESIDPDKLQDEYSKQLRELVERKLAAGDKPVETEERRSDDDLDEEPPEVDLLETIRRSIHQGNGRGNGRAGKPDLKEQSKDELYEQAQQLDIPGRSRMNKTDLIQAIRRRH